MSAPADSTHEPVNVNGPAGPEDLARVVRSRLGAHHSNMTIQLDPPELGRVRVDVKMHQDMLTLRFQTETEAGQNALQGRIRELTGALEGQGVRLDRVEIEYRPPADGHRDGQSAQQQTGQEWGEPRYHPGGQPEARREPEWSGSPDLDGFAPGAGEHPQAEWSAFSGVDLMV